MRFSTATESGLPTPRRLHRCVGVACLLALLQVPVAALAAPESGETGSLAERRLTQVLEREAALFGELERRSGELEQALLDNEERAQRIVRDYEGLTRDFPELAEGFIAYGRFLQRTGRAREAAALFMQALRLNPDIAVANQQLASWHAANDEPEKALPLILRAVALGPDQAAYHYDLGSILAAGREKLLADRVLDRAALDAQMLRAFTRATELAPDNRIFAFRQAEALGEMEKPDWEQALAAWISLRARVGEGAALHAVLIQMARCHLELGRRTEAISLIESVPAETPLKEARANLKARIDSTPEMAIPQK